ncbi:MAG: peptidoglycan-binding protein [Clostridia bacterium]|nr:peptidoglycan-binding protein [Clostridia bacterium]
MTRMIHRFLCLALAAVMMAALIPVALNQTAMADSSLGIVTKDSVSFRVGPTMSDKHLFRLDKGTVWQVLSQVDSDGYHWYEIIALDPATKKKEYTGYIRGDCFRLLTDAEAESYKKGNYIDPNNGGNNNDNNNNNNNNNNGGDGEVLGYVQTIKGSVNIRAAIGGTSLTQVAKYVTMPYLLSPVKRGNYTWYFVQLSNGMKGYVRGDCVKIVKGGGGGGGGTVTPTPTPTSTGGGGGSTDTPTGYVTTTMDNVNIRKGVWGDLVTVCKKKGTTFPYYGEPRVSGSVKWYFIKGDFGYAYIHGNYVKVTGGGGGGGTVTPTPTPVNPIDPNANNKNEATYTTLRYGSKGLAVENLVKELKNQGYYEGNVTTNYNTKVENAVRAFQKAKGLASDGIAGSKTQHALFNTVEPGKGNRSNLGFDMYPAEMIDWWTGGINELWTRGSNYKVYDVKTGLVWWAHRWAGGYHVDAEPLTVADTAVLCKIYGVSSADEITEKTHWQRRPCLVTIGTRTFACSLYGVPHNYPEGDTISDNAFKGQLCLHFTNSKTHNGKSVDSNHQKAIQEAYDWYYGTYKK